MDTRRSRMTMPALIAIVGGAVVFDQLANRLSSDSGATGIAAFRWT